MEMTGEKLNEIKERVLDVIRDYEGISVNEVISFFAFMLGKVIQMSALGNTELALGIFKEMIPGIENILRRSPFFPSDVDDILNTIKEINEEKEEK